MVVGWFVLVMRLVSVWNVLVVCAVGGVDFALWIRNSIRRKFLYSNLLKVLRMVSQNCIICHDPKSGRF